jgi:O-antigen/teichoic acid export membrane protein
VCYGAYYIVAIGVGLAQKTAHIGWTTATAAVLTIACNIILAPRFGIAGTAFSALLGNMTSTYLLYRISQRYYPIPYDQRRVAAIVALAGALMLVGIYCDHIFPLGATLLLLKIGLVLVYAALILLVILHRADIAAARAILQRAVLPQGTSRERRA